MTEKEMLELAAKAYGVEIVGWETQSGVEIAILDDLSRWQPLHANSATDCMGDALRLAVKLGMNIVRGYYAVTAEIPAADNGEGYASEDWPFGNDEDEATRRAIVRAAAMIGKAMTTEGTK